MFFSSSRCRSRRSSCLAPSESRTVDKTYDYKLTSASLHISYSLHQDDETATIDVSLKASGGDGSSSGSGDFWNGSASAQATGSAAVSVSSPDVSCGEGGELSGPLTVNWSAAGGKTGFNWDYDGVWPEPCSSDLQTAVAGALLSMAENTTYTDPPLGSLQAGSGFSVSAKGSVSTSDASGSYTFAASFNGAPPVTTPDCIFTVSSLRGTPTSGGSALHRGERVAAGSTITAGAGESVELRLAGGDVVRISSGSTVKLTSAYCRPAGGDRFSFKMLFGKIWSKISRAIGPNDRFEIETKNAVVGVRGTIFEVTYDPARIRTTARAISHTVYVRAAGTRLAVTQGHCAEVIGRGRPRLGC